MLICDVVLDGTLINEYISSMLNEAEKMTGQVKAMWMDEIEAKHISGVANHFKLEIPMIERTPIIEAWAFKGQVYCKLWEGTNAEYIRKMVMYRLNTPLLSEDRSERLSDVITEKGDIDLFLWTKVKDMETQKLGPTREELIAEGKRTGICQVCNRKLTNPESVAAGIGPVCAGRI